MKAKARTKSGRKHPVVVAATRPHGVPILGPDSVTDEAPDQPFAEGVADQLDPDLRHRLISEAAFQHQVERGYNSDYEDDDWRDAEGEVDHVVLNPSPDRKPDGSG